MTAQLLHSANYLPDPPAYAGYHAAYAAAIQSKRRPVCTAGD